MPSCCVAAGGIIRFVERHRPRNDLDEHRTAVAVPATLRSGREGDGLHCDVNRVLGIDIDLPIAGLSLDLEAFIERSRFIQENVTSEAPATDA